MSIQFGPTLAYHVLCLLPLLLVQSDAQRSCSDHVVCRGSRPLLPNRCCPVEAGHACQPDNGTICDVELGFSCVNAEGGGVVNGTGFCRGRFNLNVTSVWEKNITIEWSEFAPAGYLYEYVLLFREGTNHIDLAQWKRKEIGRKSSYTLRRLTPATLYFLKVAVWQDARQLILGNISETIMVETHSVEYCEHRGHLYAAGEQFIHDCEDNCTCLRTGKIDCTPLCPEVGVPELEEGCHVTVGNTCCDYRIVCPVAGEPCSIDGQSYSHGQEFEKGCRNCTCNQGEEVCVYPEECQILEPTESCLYPRSIAVAGQCCPQWYCANSCSYENRTYSHLEYFTSDNCGLCQCDTVNNVHCTSNCPPVEMILPDAACPDPHIRQDGCCDTLYCHDLSLDTAQTIRRIFALSYSPVTLTISFEVDPQSEVNGVPLFCQYQILYANTSDPLVTWHSRLVQPVDVRLHHDQPNLLEPTEALTRDNAIVVGDRAYVTISGMYPNTTYYVKIIPLSGYWEDMAESSIGNYSYSDKISVVVVVKTLPLENMTSCLHNGKEVLHGQNVSVHCGQDCTCILGRISCESACESERVVMATSLTCPRPRLEKQPGACCSEWACYPSATGCRYGGIIMESGQSVTTEDCQVCTCSNASIHCRSVCPPSGLPPRPGCVLVNISGECCPQWQCQREKHPPLGVRSSLLIHFQGSCLSSVSNFLEDMSTKIVSYVTNIMGCSNKQSDLAKFCNTVQVTIFCPSASDDVGWHRKRRSVYSNLKNTRIPVTVSVHMNFSSTYSELMTARYVQYAGLQLVSSLNSSFSIVLDSGQVMKTLEGAQFEGESFMCDQGFTFVKEFCVLSEIESSLSFRPNLQLNLEQVSNCSVTLEWPTLGDQIQRHITGLMIEHRKDGHIQWLSSSKLDSTVTSYNLTALNSDQSFSVRLIALTHWSGQDKWKIGEVHFRTRPTSAAMTLRSNFELTEVTVGEDNAYFYWGLLPDQSQLMTVSVLHKQTRQKQYQYENHAKLMDNNYVQLKNLEPNTAYTAEIILHLSTDEKLNSFPVHFVTLSTRTGSTELLIAVVVSSVALTSVIVSLSCVIWRQNRKKNKNNGFENKIFGIQLENNNGDVQTEPTSNPAVN